MGIQTVTIDKNLYDFLISVCFGNTEGEDIYEKCVEKAYRDFSRTIHYKFSLAVLKSDKEKKNRMDNIKREMLKNVINTIRNSESDTDPGSIIDVVSKMSTKYDIFEGNGLTYGQAQKWVNMSLKYMWLLQKCPIKEELLHAPIDRFIIHALTEDKNMNPFGIELKGVNLNSDMAWSKDLDGEQYISIQRELKNRIKEPIGGRIFRSVIDWENAVWIEQSKIESSK